MRRQDAAIASTSGLGDRIEHDSAGAVSKQDAGGTVAPIEQAGKRLRSYDQRALERARSQQAIRRREREYEAGAYRLQIECGPPGDAKPGLYRHRGCGKGIIRCRGCQHHEVD